MKVFVALCLFLICTQALDVQEVILAEQWALFKENYNKTYNKPEVEIYRMEVFFNNTKKIAEHNALYDKGKVTYSLAINQFSDLLPEEFVKAITCVNGVPEEYYSIGLQWLPPLNFEAPGMVDWRRKGLVTPVKNQGQCGSCWSFASTGVLEGQIKRKFGHLPTLSEQNLVDCSRDRYGNHGCHGGFMIGAYNYIHDNNGIDSEQSYPYRGNDNGNCRYKSRGKQGTVSHYYVIHQGENYLMQAVASQGPVAVAIQATQGFQHYSRGVFFDPSCNGQINHAVLVVGYGTEGGQPYWLVKNSWGGGWGEGGYIKMARNRGNNCHISSYGSLPAP